MEAWQAWDLALRCGGQLRTMQTVVIGMDFKAYLKMAETLGYSCAVAAEFAPACEEGMVAAVNERIKRASKIKI